MQKSFCIPVYNETAVIFNNHNIELALINKWLLKDLLTYDEVAKNISDICSITIGKSAIQKLVKHYNIVFSPEIKHLRAKRRAATIATNLQEKFGVTNVFELSEIKAKAAETKLKKYGDANYTNKAKTEQTCIDRYGVKNYSSTAECRKKVATANIAKFGVTAPAKNKQILEKMQTTCIEKFGVDNYWKSDEFKNYQQQKYFEQYNLLSDSYKQIYKDTDKLANYISTLEDKTVIGIAKSFGISRASAYLLLSKHNLLDLADMRTQDSHYELDIINFIGQDICEHSNRFILDGKEIDIYIPTKKIGIEFNGDYWHSTCHKPKKYHFNKSILAESKGIRLIHIWEHEWLDPITQSKIKMMLNIALGRATEKIYARQCTVKTITNKEAKLLNDSVHLQNHRDANVTYGLYYKDKLVQLMSFSKTRYNKNIQDDNTWEIIRGCPGSNNIVVGGVSRLLKHFIADYKPTKIFSYCDFNKFDGKSYEAAGMKFIGYTGPDMKWLMPDGSVINRKPRHHAELKAIAKAQLFGAGSKKYLLEL